MLRAAWLVFKPLFTVNQETTRTNTKNMPTTQPKNQEKRRKSKVWNRLGSQSHPKSIPKSTQNHAKFATGAWSTPPSRRVKMGSVYQRNKKRAEPNRVATFWSKTQPTWSQHGPQDGRSAVNSVYVAHRVSQNSSDTLAHVPELKPYGHFF